uniref:Uncharacterized protein n=1 Tax=Cacopsylla melanoneura TaxID=428564 RepID=A0A8D8VCX8_9HEMI
MTLSGHHNLYYVLLQSLAFTNIQNGIKLIRVSNFKYFRVFIFPHTYDTIVKPNESPLVHSSQSLRFKKQDLVWFCQVLIDVQCSFCPESLFRIRIHPFGSCSPVYQAYHNAASFVVA